MRVFISINIPENIRKEIVKIQNSLPEFIGKKTESENLHLTLKFLGDVDEDKIEEIKDNLRRIKIGKFETNIDEIGFFDNSESRFHSKRLIIWLHLKNCEKLQKEVDEVLHGFFEKEKRFMSHLTIARIKKINNKKKFLEDLFNIKIKKENFLVDKFYLMKSELTKKGPMYSVLNEFSLI